MPTRKFTSKEVEDLVLKGIKTYGMNRRWSRSTESIVTVDDRKYRLYYEEGLTEAQVDDYPEQEAVEVREIEVIVPEHTVKSWIEF